MLLALKALQSPAVENEQSQMHIPRRIGLTCGLAVQFSTSSRKPSEYFLVMPWSKADCVGYFIFFVLVSGQPPMNNFTNILKRLFKLIYDEVTSAQLSYNLTNSLNVSEMGITVASDSGSLTMEPTRDPYTGSVNFLTADANKYTITTLTSGFGRFLTGPDPFEIFLTLAGSASSDNPGMTDVYFNFEGNASLIIDYDYTPVAPVPEPMSMLLFVTGILGIGGYVRREVKD